MDNSLPASIEYTIIHFQDVTQLPVLKQMMPKVAAMPLKFGDFHTDSAVGLSASRIPSNCTFTWKLGT